MAATIMAINERAHIDLNGLDLNDEPAILGATDGSFFFGPGGEKLVTAISLVGSITFRFFITAMRRPDLAADPRFSTPAARRANLEALKAVVQAWIYSFSSLAALDAQFDEGKIAIGEVRSLDAIAGSEWADYWGATLSVDDRNGGEFRLPGRPWKFSDAELPMPCGPAMQGEHNRQICTELGMDSDAIDTLEASGALVGNNAAKVIASVLGAHSP
jgi:crotonobetainyl-CoA:carnitine CoA-transferase CaiB-like acyl-CoA transferase